MSQDNLKIVCYDEDLISNDVVGECYLKPTKLFSTDFKRHWLPLTFKGKKSAEILLEAKYSPGIQTS